MQTAVGVFGGEGYTDRKDVVPLMVANAGNSYRSAISSLNCPPIMAVELCREHLVCSYMLLHRKYLLTLVQDCYIRCKNINADIIKGSAESGKCVFESMFYLCLSYGVPRFDWTA